MESDFSLAGRWKDDNQITSNEKVAVLSWWVSKWPEG